MIGGMPLPALAGGAGSGGGGMTELMREYMDWLGKMHRRAGVQLSDAAGQADPQKMLIWGAVASTFLQCLVEARDMSEEAAAGVATPDASTRGTEDGR
jgi:hypothetical protein